MNSVALIEPLNVRFHTNCWFAWFLYRLSCIFVPTYSNSALFSVSHLHVNCSIAAKKHKNTHTHTFATCWQKWTDESPSITFLSYVNVVFYSSPSLHHIIRLPECPHLRRKYYLPVKQCKQEAVCLRFTHTMSRSNRRRPFCPATDLFEQTQLGITSFINQQNYVPWSKAASVPRAKTAAQNREGIYLPGAASANCLDTRCFSIGIRLFPFYYLCSCVLRSCSRSLDVNFVKDNSFSGNV